MAGRLCLMLAAALLCACESNDDPPAPSPGHGADETITGRERIGWDQRAASASELSTFRYAIYVDGTRSELGGVSCASSEGASGFPCSGQLPSMASGSHVLELAAFITSGGGIVESARSSPLRVTVTGSTAPAGSDASTLENGAQLVTRDGVRLIASLLVERLQDVSDLARTSDGRLLIAERRGAVVILARDREPFRTSLDPRDGELLALAPSPAFASNGHLFVVQSASGVSRVVRYRFLDGQFIERMVLLPDVPASANAAAALRFGPDGKLYAAFDDAGRRDAASTLSEWTGKILRLNEDGTTPEDQPAASPVFWSGIAEPLGIDWTVPPGTMWMAERGTDRVERIRALATGSARPRRAGQHASYVLPGSVGASSLAFYRSEVIPQFRGNLFIAARYGMYLLRVQFDETERLRAVTTEKLLEGQLADLRSVVTSPDGALYVANGTSLWRLDPVDAPRASAR
jgi:glucose/arabinose dehydrogenase